MKNSSDAIGNRTRDLPTCSAVPQPTAPSRAPENSMRWGGYDPALRGPPLGGDTKEDMKLNITKCLYICTRYK